MIVCRKNVALGLPKTWDPQRGPSDRGQAHAQKGNLNCSCENDSLRNTSALIK
jgi:hypothetical protein